MRCTKCHYLSFEPEARCRNCGHDLSIDNPSELAVDQPLDLPLDEPADHTFDLGDLPLRGMVAEASAARELPRRAQAIPPAPVTAAPMASGTVRPLRRSSEATAVALSPEDYMPVTAELPLFVQDIADVDDPEPLVKVPAQPRAPIAVRRSTPDPARLRAKYAPVSNEAEWTPDLLEQAEAAVDLSPASTADVPGWISEPTPERLPAEWQQPVAGGTRLAAASIDFAFLSAIALVVTGLTLRLAGLSMGQIGVLPIWPMAGFFMLIAAGYLLLFTAVNGQTIGKMALGIRVVGTSTDAVINDRVTVSQAAVRAVSALPSVLVLGVGFVPALMGAGLAVHDRVAHTRVVRA